LQKHNKRYKTIMADPPWGGKEAQQGGTYGAINHYNLMSLEQIKSMPITDLVEDDAHLWLWVTNAIILSGHASETV